MRTNNLDVYNGGVDKREEGRRFAENFLKTSNIIFMLRWNTQSWKPNKMTRQ